MKKKIPTEFWMILPALIVLVVITVFPFIYTVQLSFKHYPYVQVMSGIREVEWVGLRNWVRMFTDPKVALYWIVTLKYALGALSCEIILGIAAALLLNRIRIFQDLLTTLSLSPMFFAPVLVGLMGRYMLHDSYGVYSYFAHQLGLFKDISIFGDGKIALLALIGLDIWEWTPLVTIIVLAGLKSLPREPFEAASIDGANAWQKLGYLTLPMLKPILFVALIIRTMDILRYFVKFLVTTRGGPADATKIIAIGVYDQAFQAWRMGYAATLTISMLIVTIVLGMVFVRFFSGMEQE